MVLNNEKKIFLLFIYYGGDILYNRNNEFISNTFEIQNANLVGLINRAASFTVR